MDAIGASVARDAGKVRRYGMRAAVKATRALARMDGVALCDHKRAIAAKNWHAVAASTHGWSEREAGTEINLNVLTIDGAMRVSDSGSS